MRDREGFVARNYSRRFSIYFTALLLPTGITANQTTILGIIIGVTGSLFFLKGTYWWNIIGVLLLHLWHILDYSDGEIARYRNNCSETGIFLDRLSHNFVDISIFICIGFGLYNSTQNAFMLVLGVIAAFSLVSTYNIIALKSSILPAGGDKKEKSNIGIASKKKLPVGLYFINKIFHSFFSISFFWSTGGIIWILLLCSIFDRILWALLFFACTTPFRLSFKIIETIKELNIKVIPKADPSD